MTNDNGNVKSIEQNKKTIADDFYQQLQIILEKDEFGIFKTATKRKLNRTLQVTESQIQKLVDLKLRSTKQIKTFAVEKKKLKSQNNELKKSIIKQLNLEVI
jgi:hypothetical protein